ncbi:MAG: LamG domain-containing protein, partial [Sedimentisphaerales bacterium]|nr:LamG domain-containing protein [Sedimentisphaerales bacterium]
MRRLCVVVGLTCFLCGAALAVDYRGVGTWEDPNNWSDGVVPTGAVEVKIRGEETVLTLNTSTGDWGAAQRVRVYEGATMIVEDGAQLLGGGWVRIGAGSLGVVEQTGGLVQIDNDRLGIGDGGGSDGRYTISGGTITYVGDRGDLTVGARGGLGLLTIVGADAVIHMTDLIVPQSSGGNGAIEFQLTADGVTPIVLDDLADIDALGDETTAALVIGSADGAPQADVLLVDLPEGADVANAFDTVNGEPALEGAAVAVQAAAGVYSYILTYIGGDTANDIVLLFDSFVPAPKIIWVSDNSKYDFEADAPADAGFVNLLRAQGYQVDYKGEAWPYDPNDDEIALNPDWQYWRQLDPNKVDELNAADLVIISRIANSGDYDDVYAATGYDERVLWNGITTPMISMSAHLARSGYNKWGWLNTGGHPYTTDNVHNILDPNHPVFAGIEVDPNGQADILTDEYTVNGSDPADADAGNGVTLATRASDNAIMISYWEAGVEYFDGAGFFAGGPRMFFAAGSGNGSPRDGMYDLTADGEQTFLNAVAYMIAAAVPGRDALVASYHLDGDTFDSSPNMLDGLIAGDPNFVEGQVGLALQLDGIDDYVECGTSPLFDLIEQVTLSAWVRPNDIGNGQDNPWVGKGDRSYALKGFRTGNVVEFFIYDSTWVTAHADVGDAFNGEWHHAAGSYDGAQLKVYIDGELAAVTDYVGAIALSASSINIGKNSDKT